jgi:hypothetical protein
MECNFRWKFYRQSQSDNIHICLVSGEGNSVVRMTSKKIFEITLVLRERCIFWEKNLC